MMDLCRYRSDREVQQTTESLLDHTLPKERWTHAAHCAATIYLLRNRPDIDLDAELPGIIRSYNRATGVNNSDYSGYHETITRFYIAIIKLFSEKVGPETSTREAVSRCLNSPLGRPDFPLVYYSKERLFSVEARRNIVSPDIRSFPASIEELSIYLDWSSEKRVA